MNDEIKTTPPAGSGNGNFESTGHNYDEGAPPAVRAREEVNRNRKLSPGAKFFFGWLTDNSYLRSRGGDGHGRIAIAVTDIRKLTGHDKKSVTRWAKELDQYIWIEQEKIPNAYAVNRYCVRALVPGGQQLRLEGLAQAWGRVRGDRGKFSHVDFPHPELIAPSESPEKVPLLTQSRPQPLPQDATSQAASCHLAGTVSATSEAASCHLTGGEKGSGEGASCPPRGGGKGSGEAAITVRIKETPTEIRRLGDKGSVPTAPAHTPLPRFEPLDRKCVARLRPKLGEQMIERYKEKIFSMENSRKPLSNQKDIIAAYKKRIGEVKSWIAGEL